MDPAAAFTPHEISWGSSQRTGNPRDTVKRGRDCHKLPTHRACPLSTCQEVDYSKETKRCNLCPHGAYVQVGKADFFFKAGPCKIGQVMINNKKRDQLSEKGWSSRGCCFVQGGQGSCRSERASEPRTGRGEAVGSYTAAWECPRQAENSKKAGWRGWRWLGRVGDTARKGWTLGREGKQQEDKRKLVPRYASYQPQTR